MIIGGDKLRWSDQLSIQSLASLQSNKTSLLPVLRGCGVRQVANVTGSEANLSVYIFTRLNRWAFSLSNNGAHLVSLTLIVPRGRAEKQESS
ncbi:hypothetical protein F383_19664 [Gossypium arboreum]|uniref:Uncharacterized protein n=1 Tax=Gossypium arboreum TaxID=29729 RepID=A0A0B0MNI5_GOSAR|nr:hypothetical protein F383_19664 [Gossypium arboreum]